MQKLLIIRFSSLGDIAQGLTAAEALKKAHPTAAIHWVTRSDFTQFVQSFSAIEKVWAFERRQGFLGLIRLALALRVEKYDFIYDAHSNVRSRIISCILWRPFYRLIRRSKERFKRFLLFKMRINTFKMPYRGSLSYLQPISAYIVDPNQAPYLTVKSESESDLTAATKNTILLAPSAAWELKKWPTEYWQKLIQLLKTQLPQYEIALLGGPEDNFDALTDLGVKNLAGQLSWKQTLYAIKNAPLVISGDTGALHVADGLNVPTVAIIGPTAFGHPSRANSAVAEHALYCRPCTKDGRGRCYNATFKKCLLEVTPETVILKAKHQIGH